MTAGEAAIAEEEGEDDEESEGNGIGSTEDVLRAVRIGDGLDVKMASSAAKARMR